jgi:hypothetical protein
MKRRSSWLRGSVLVFVLVVLAAGLLAVPEANARGSRGGHSRGRVARPHVAAPRAYKAPRMPHIPAPARVNHKAHAPANPQHAPATAAAASRAPSIHGSGSGNHSAHHNTYTYGYGTSARHYRAYGYGRGYRNRSYGSRYGYGRSQGQNRAVVARLRSVHANLARIDHDYQGHRVRAMHAVSMAIRQLTHQSMVYRGVGFAPGAGGNNNPALALRRGGVGGPRRPHMTQAQSDARMSQALRTLQGINMQLTNHGYHTGGHARARGHVQSAMRELNTALAIR